MKDLRLFCGILLVAGALQLSFAGESEDSNDGVKDLFDTVGQNVKGFGDFFKGVADGAKEKSEEGMEVLKNVREDAKGKAENAAESMKGFAEGMGDRFSKAKEKLSETGDKMKEAFGDAAQKSKKEFETAATDISKYAMDAGGTVMKMFG